VERITTSEVVKHKEDKSSTEAGLHDGSMEGKRPSRWHKEEEQQDFIVQGHARLSSLSRLSNSGIYD